MCVKNWCAAVLLGLAEVCAGQTSLVTTTTLAAQTANNTSTANRFTFQSNGNMGANNVSKVDIHTLLYSGATTKVYAQLLLWFGGSKPHECRLQFDRSRSDSSPDPRPDQSRDRRRHY